MSSVTIIYFAVILLFSGLYLVRKNNIGNILMVLFAYSSLHYGYAILIAMSEYGYNTSVSLHITGTPVYTKIIGGIVISTCLLLLIVRAKFLVNFHQFYSSSVAQPVIILFSFFAIFLLIGTLNFIESLTNMNEVRFIIKSNIYSMSMWFTALVIPVALYFDKKKLTDYKKDIRILFFILFVFITLVGCYEVASGIAYAITGSAVRASSTLYNPNVYGVWNAFMLIGVWFLFEKKIISKIDLYFLIALGVFSFCLSASRSGFLLYIMMVACILVLSRQNKLKHKAPESPQINLLPIRIFVILFSIYSIFIIILDYLFNVGFITTLHENVNRILYLPYDIFYIIKGVISPAVSLTSEVPSQIYLKNSIIGRFSNVIKTDNSYIFIKIVAGYQGLLVWFMMFGYIGWLGIKKYIKYSCVNSVFSLAILVGIILSGILLRTFQVFPLWIFMSFLLGLLLYGWLFYESFNLTGKNDIRRTIR